MEENEEISLIHVTTSGRTDIEEYFEKSGIRDWKKLDHNPLLVFIVSENAVEVCIIDEPTALLTFPDETKVMGQWTGQWHSDFFQFTIGELRQHIANHPKTPHRVI
jgi:hypothetical protein